MLLVTQIKHNSGDTFNKFYLANNTCLANPSSIILYGLELLKVKVDLLFICEDL